MVGETPRTQACCDQLRSASQAEYAGSIPVIRSRETPIDAAAKKRLALALGSQAADSREHTCCD